MQGVNHIAIALRLRYVKTQHQYFDAACTYFESIYASGRMTFPIKSLLVIGNRLKEIPTRRSNFLLGGLKPKMPVRASDLREFDRKFA